MSEINNVSQWHQIYNNEFGDWQRLYELRSGNRILYRFSVDELSDNFSLSFPIYHNSIIEDDFIKAKTMVKYIKDNYSDNLAPDKLRKIVDIIKSDYKKNDIIDTQKSFNIIDQFIQTYWDLNPIESDICSRQLLSAFGRKLGYCYESLSKPGLNKSEDFITDSSITCSCKSDEECSVCAPECDCGSDDECDICRHETCNCGTDDECSICAPDCECKTDEECSVCAPKCDCGSDDECSICALDCDCKSDEECSVCADDTCSCKSNEECDICTES